MKNELLREYVRCLIEAYMQNGHEGSTAQDLDLDKPGTMMEPDVRKAVASYLKKMGLIKGRPPKKYRKPKVQPRLA